MTTTQRTLAIFGNTPALSALELGIPYAGGQLGEVAHDIDLERVGGTVKIASVIGELPRTLKGLEDLLFPLLEAIPTDHRTVYGFSVYGAVNGITKSVIKDYSSKLRKVGITWKKQLRNNNPDRSIRFVVSDDPGLSSVIVTREHLIPDQTDFVLAVHQNKIVVARTTAVQDYKGFSDRDFGRPQRDHFSGMLPPKVARMMLNIAQPVMNEVILDPFCGSGTVVQEALALGYKHVIGSDISEKCIDDTKANVAWAKLPEPELHVSDVLKLPNLFQRARVNVVVAEGYLGPQHQGKMDKKMFENLTRFYGEVFQALAQITKPGGRLVLALPAWKRNTDNTDGLIEMELDGAIRKAGFTAFHKPLIYGREAARVVRKIYFLNAK